jgi:hypothetical protein
LLRLASGVVGAGLLTLLALAWIPRHNYRSIQPGERGTFGEAAVALRYLPQHPSQLDTKATAHDVRTTSPTNPTSTTVPLVQTGSSTTLGGGFTTSTTAFGRQTSTTVGITSPSTAGGTGGTTPVTTVP